MLKKIATNQIKQLYDDHLSKDFPVNERPPYEMLLKQLETRIQEGFILYDEEAEGQALGYCINAASHPNGYVLISQFAAMSGSRGKGVGTLFMKALFEHYRDARGIFVEVEKPEDSTNENEQSIRERRIQFYERLGYVLLPSIDYTLFKVPMYIMVRPLQDSLRDEAFYMACMTDIYKDLLDSSKWEKFQISMKESGSN